MAVSKLKDEGKFPCEYKVLGKSVNKALNLL